MKTILVLTDLGKKAENAALYAFRLAEKAQSNVILYHSFTVFQSVAVPETGMWPVDDYEQTKNESLTQLQVLANNLRIQSEPGKFIPEIDILNGTGNLEDTVQEMLKEKNIDLIVMGAKSADVLSHLFTGSETNHMIDEVKCPILFVPEDYWFHPFKTIVFATDLKKAYPEAVSFVVDLALINCSQIIIAHVGEGGNFSPAGCLKLVKEVYEYPNVSFRQLPDGNTNDQLKSFITYAGADLTVMVHHKHSLIGELIPGSNSKKMLYKHKNPVLVLPDI